MAKILFLIPYPLQEAPSQRFRFEQYFEILQKNGFEFTIQSFLSRAYWRLFYKKGNSIRKAIVLITGFFKRFLILFTVYRYHYIFIHREATPLGPPIIEFIVTRIFKKKVIFDFDDAIWLTDRSNEPRLVSILKCRSKVKSICRWSYQISAGNEYLCTFARKFNHRVILNPTTIDTNALYTPALLARQDHHALTIGWTGSHSTLKYLQPLEKVLNSILTAYPYVKLVIIADQPPRLSIPFTFIYWKKETEIEDLLKIDIGIMPLPDDEWSKGKCGFKALQYMALGIPAVVSPVGVNPKIIKNGDSGFLCKTNADWESAIQQLIVKPDLRLKIGEAGRQIAEKNYSVISNTSTFLSLFE